MTISAETSAKVPLSPYGSWTMTGHFGGSSCLHRRALSLGEGSGK